MVLEQKLNEKPVVLRIAGHSLMDGAPIPEGSAVVITSNDESVATVVSPVTVPAGGAAVLDVAVTQIAAGTTDFHVTVDPPDHSGPFEATATLILIPVSIPGLASVSADLIQVG